MVVVPCGGAAALPALVYVHGGGWREGTRDESVAAQEWLAEQGFAFFSSTTASLTSRA